MTAFSAPDFGEQQPFCMVGDGCPQLGCGRGKFWDGFDGHKFLYNVNVAIRCTLLLEALSPKRRLLPRYRLSDQAGTTTQLSFLARART